MNETYHFRQIEEAVKRLEKKNQNLEKQISVVMMIERNKGFNKTHYCV